jgi:hypothetical protein
LAISSSSLILEAKNAKSKKPPREKEIKTVRRFSKN